jgi:1,4-dihydroxy-6-naphthoate synthase
MEPPETRLENAEEPQVSTPPPGPTALRTLRLGHSPDPDDAFMFYPMLSGKIPCEGLAFEQHFEGIETLNRLVLRGELDVAAASVHACALMGETYRILDCGASVGDGYGPLIVSRKPMTMEDLSGVEVAVPGILTTAYLTMRIAAGPVRFTVMPFDKILPAVAEGTAEAGLIIHEGQLTYASAGLHKVIDLGEWWKESTGLPLPLGVNVIRSSLGPDLIRTIGETLKRSIDYALEHREEALRRAAEFGRGIDAETTDRFVSMYVNDYTRSLGTAGREAIERLLGEGRSRGLIPEKPGPFFA